jgi:hypothetical protein
MFEVAVAMTDDWYEKLRCPKHKRLFRVMNQIAAKSPDLTTGMSSAA